MSAAFLMTPEQHLQAAHRLRSLAAQPGAYDPAWALRIARNHEMVAYAIARRQQLQQPSPSLAPE
jgi:hypothetical protein